MRRRLFVAALLIVSSVCVDAMGSRKKEETYLKIRKLRQFFRRYQCPAAAYAYIFVRVAEEYSLDYRLLPAIAFVESTGGLHVFRRHNWFGWASGEAAFPSVESAIRTVAEHLAEDVRYRGKTLYGRLATYNHHPDYPGKVFRVMAAIESTKA